MLTCSDCLDELCANYGLDVGACDDVALCVDDVQVERVDKYRSVEDRLKAVEDELEGLSCKFFDVLSAITRATSSEEER